MKRLYPCVMVVTHAHGHDDGGYPILNHLTHKYLLAALDGKALFNVAGRIARDWREKTRETLVIEGPYPLNAAGIAARVGVAPQKVTHSLMICDALTFANDRFGGLIRSLADQNGTTGIALGNVGTFDSASFGVVTMDDLGQETYRLVNYVEQYLRLPVVFLATSPETVIDREPHRAHEAEDKSQVVTIGAANERA
jgi:hypothetical protein